MCFSFWKTGDLYVPFLLDKYIHSNCCDKTLRKLYERSRVIVSLFLYLSKLFKPVERYGFQFNTHYKSVVVQCQRVAINLVHVLRFMYVWKVHVLLYVSLHVLVGCY